jgi:hypothetical protein
MTAGPFIVTHRRGHDAGCQALGGFHPIEGDEAALCSCGAPVVLYHEAFATLELTRVACNVRINVAFIDAGRPTGDMAWHSLSLSGATFGLDAGGRIELPDGTEIEVKPLLDAFSKIAPLVAESLTEVEDNDSCHLDGMAWLDHIAALRGTDVVDVVNVALGDAQDGARPAAQEAPPCANCEGSGRVWGEDEDGNADDPECESSCGRCGGTGTAAARETAR